MIVFLLRLLLAFIFASIGNIFGRSSVPPNAPIQVPTWTGLAATLIFGLVGFFLPNILSFLAKAGIVRLAQELGEHLPQIPKSPIKIKLPKRKASNQKAIIVDTSAIVDGRIFEIVKTGFWDENLVIIPQVLSELQHLADSSDSLKRARGRKALDLLGELKKEKRIGLKITAVDPGGKNTDEKIVQLAKKIKTPILTCDFNLEKVAKLKNVQVLNINQLAQAVRMQVLPGEELKISLVHVGKNQNQGVGYLPDGTMVVVEDGGKLIGKEVKVMVHRSLQTLAGRMIFAKTAQEGTEFAKT